MEELQTAWEDKCKDPRYALYKPAITDGLAKLNKYYSRFDEKPAFILALGESLLHFPFVTKSPSSPPPVLQAHLHQVGMGRREGTAC